MIEFLFVFPIRDIIPVHIISAILIPSTLKPVNYIYSKHTKLVPTDFIGNFYPVSNRKSIENGGRDEWIKPYPLSILCIPYETNCSHLHQD